jgi:hypothetical protein
MCLKPGVNSNLAKYPRLSQDPESFEKTFSYRNSLIPPNVSRKRNVYVGSVVDAAEKGDSDLWLMTLNK